MGPQAASAVEVASAPKAVSVAPELIEYLRLTCAVDRGTDVTTANETLRVAYAAVVAQKAR
jgi:hypothetical protein